jgi:hypothetical protein
VKPCVFGSVISDVWDGRRAVFSGYD